MMNDNEIHLQKLWVVVKSRGGKTSTETAIWVDNTIIQMLVDRGEIRDVDSVRFCRYTDEAFKFLTTDDDE